jgi:hypothetical protein
MAKHNHQAVDREEGKLGYSPEQLELAEARIAEARDR